jgi:imidazolonepropionase-like amidohydrolase
MFRLVVSLLAAALSLAAQTLVLQHARIIDGNGGPPLEDGAIVISKGRIQAIGASSAVKAPSGAQVVDLSGKTIIPGIINMHGHVGNVKGLKQDRSFYTQENAENNLRLYALYGVTTTTSMGSDEDVILRIRERERDGRVIGARILTALQGFTYQGGYPTQVPGVKGVALEVSTPAQARVKVDQLAKKGADMIKMWVDDHHDHMKKLPPEICAAIIAQAHKHNKLAFAHIYELEDAQHLVDSGLNVLGHSIRDHVVDDAFIAKLKQKNVTQVPTLMREVSTFVYAEAPEWLSDPFFARNVDPAVIEGLKTTMKENQLKDPERAINKKGLEIAMENLKKISDAGVRIGFGTDTGPPGRFPGFFEHMELELMVKSGLSPMKVIQSFSKDASEALRIAKNFGTLEKGKVADLVVLDRNPLDDIRNSRSIHAVYIGGKKFE